MNKKHLQCTTQWVGLPQDIVSMYLLSERQWQLQSQHRQQCISTPTASDLLKPTSFEPVIASKAMQCNASTISQCAWIFAMDCSSGTQDHPHFSLWNPKLLSKDGPDFKQFPNRFAEWRCIDCAHSERSCRSCSLLSPGRIIHTEHEHENELQLQEASATAIRSLPLRSSRWSKIVTSFSSVSSSLVVDIAMLMIVLSEAATPSPAAGAAVVPQGPL